jgi:hypothetical protein
MASVSRQIGWSNESNLLYQILKQITRLTAVIFSLKPTYKVYSALLEQQIDGTVSVIAEFDNTVGVADFTGSTLGDISIVFSSLPSYTNALGYCYSGGDGEDTFYPWLVKYGSSPAVQLLSTTALSFVQNIIRVDIKILI